MKVHLNDEKDYKLPSNVKEDWIGALRSGEYEQGAAQLHKNGKYCCIGVLAALCYVGVHIMGNEGYLNEDMMENSDGIGNAFGEGSNIAGKLVSMNDGCDGERARSFKEIADFIEKEL